MTSVCVHVYFYSMMHTQEQSRSIEIFVSLVLFYTETSKPAKLCKEILSLKSNEELGEMEQ